MKKQYLLLLLATLVAGNFFINLSAMNRSVNDEESSASPSDSINSDSSISSYSSEVLNEWLEEVDWDDLGKDDNSLVFEKQILVKRILMLDNELKKAIEHMDNVIYFLTPKENTRPVSAPGESSKRFKKRCEAFNQAKFYAIKSMIALVKPGEVGKETFKKIAQQKQISVSIVLNILKRVEKSSIVQAATKKSEELPRKNSIIEKLRKSLSLEAEMAVTLDKCEQAMLAILGKKKIDCSELLDNLNFIQLLTEEIFDDLQSEQLLHHFN